MYADRLLKLADFLTTLPEERFDYMTWVNRDTWKGDPGFSCGTTACALGWATTIPEFRELGLYMSSSGLPMLRDSDLVDTEAAAWLFDIAVAEANFLFIPTALLGNVCAPSGDATAIEVAEHIRNFVAHKQAMSTAE